MQTDAQAKKYHRTKNRLFVVNLVFAFVLLCAIIFSGFSVWLKTSLTKISASAILLNGLYITLLSTIFYILGFPLDFYEGFLLERHFGLSNQRLAGYLKDSLKKAIISLAITVVAVEFLYLFLGKFPDIWWILAAFGWFFLTVLLAKITPSVFVPLFYKYIPLEDLSLKNKIMEMFACAQTSLKDVYMIDFSKKTKKLNAAVIGFGKDRRVVLTDNLLKELTEDEILSIVAHELGHYKNKDTIKIVAFGFIVSAVLFFISDIVLRMSFLFFGYESIADISGFPLFCLAMFILGLLSMPLQNWFIRCLETKADIYSINLTRNSGVFISMMEKLAKNNLAELNPGRFIEIMLYDHPPIGKRIQLAQRLKPM